SAEDRRHFVGAHPVRDAFGDVTKSIAHKVRSYGCRAGTARRRASNIAQSRRAVPALRAAEASTNRTGTSTM
ncbi:MAG: hypothetical protein ACTHJ9_06015, partial [Rhodanobacter sp.]